MSIDFIYELERGVDGGREIYACPGVARNSWIFGKTAAELKKQAQRAADNRKMAVSIIRLIGKNEAVAGDLFLVPTKIGEPGPRGEPQVEWATVETKEAADMMKDVRKGTSPFFGMQVQETINPTGS